MRTHQTTSKRMERKTKKEMPQKQVLQHLRLEFYKFESVIRPLQYYSLLPSALTSMADALARKRLIYKFIGRIAPHFSDGVFEMNILAVEIVLGFFPHGVVVLRTFEIETQEALCAIASIASSGIDEQH